MFRRTAGIAKWIVLIPALIVVGGCLFVLDQLLPRYLLAAILIAPIAAIAHFTFGASLLPFLVATIVLGTLFAGVWENCEVFSGRSLLRLLFGRDRR